MDPEEEEQLLEESLHPIFRTGFQIINKHRDDPVYITTATAKTAKGRLDSCGAICITGICGSGKTKTALEAASLWLRDDPVRQCIYITSLEQLKTIKWHEQNNLCLILDNCISRWNIESDAGIALFQKYCGQISSYVIENPTARAIVTIDRSIYIRHKETLLSFRLFKDDNLFDISHSGYQVTLETKRNILYSHLRCGKIEKIFHQSPNGECNHDRNILCTRNSDAISKKIQENIIWKHSRQVGYPSICFMFSNIYTCFLQHTDFFLYCDHRIGIMLRESFKAGSEAVRMRMCCLSYTVLKNNKMNRENLDLECLERLCKTFDLRGIREGDIFAASEEMVGSIFLESDEQILRVSETAIFESCIRLLFIIYPKVFIELCDTDVIKNYIRSVEYSPSQVECVFVVKSNLYKNLAERLLKLTDTHPELRDHQVMRNQEFRRVYYRLELDMRKELTKCTETSSSVENQIPSDVSPMK